MKELKNKVAINNNFDSFEMAIRYTFNRELLQSEKDFLNKLIDDLVDEACKNQREDYEQMKQLATAAVRVCYYRPDPKSYWDDTMSDEKEKDYTENVKKMNELSVILTSPSPKEIK